MSVCLSSLFDCIFVGAVPWYCFCYMPTCLFVIVLIQVGDNRWSPAYYALFIFIYCFLVMKFCFFFYLRNIFSFTWIGRNRFIVLTGDFVGCTTIRLFLVSLCYFSDEFVAFSFIKVSFFVRPSMIFCCSVTVVFRF